jgi:hypothetical protein
MVLPKNKQNICGKFTIILLEMNPFEKQSVWLTSQQQQFKILWLSFIDE